MKKMLVLLLSFVLVLSLTSCSTIQVLLEKPTPTPEPTVTPEPTTEPEPEPEDEGYYDYLRDTLLPELGAATLEEKTLPLPSADSNHWETNAGTVAGVLSADVRDYDGDGVRDMLVILLTECPMGETALGRLMYGEADPCLAAEMRLYTCTGGAVALSDTVRAVTEMEGASWGPMLVSLLEIDGVPYIRGTSSMEDQTTYGAAPTALYHVENGKFVFDWMGGRIGWGQSSYKGDVNADAGAQGNKLTVEQEQCFTGSLNALFQSETDGGTAYLAEGFSMLSAVTMNLNRNAIVYRAKDYTQLSEILERGEETVKAERTPAPTPTPAPEYSGAEAEIAAVLEAVTASTGIELELISEHVNEQTHMVQYAAPEGSILSLCYVLETGKPSSIGVYAKGGDVTQEWIALKDAVLDAECLGFDPDKVEKFHGDCGFRFGSPEDAGADGATVLVGNAVACTMLAQWDN